MNAASSISTKSSRACSTERSRAAGRRPRSRGQGIVEYILIVAVVLSVILVVAKPFLKGLQTKFGDSFKGGILGERSNLYYYPVKR